MKINLKTLLAVGFLFYLLTKKTKAKTNIDKSIKPGDYVITAKDNVQTWYEAAPGKFLKFNKFNANTELGKVASVYYEYEIDDNGQNTGKIARTWLYIDYPSQYTQQIIVLNDDVKKK